MALLGLGMVGFLCGEAREVTASGRGAGETGDGPRQGSASSGMQGVAVVDRPHARSRQRRPRAWKLTEPVGVTTTCLEQRDVDRLERVAHAASHVDIRPRRLGVARRVVMNRDDGAGLKLQRAHADLAGIDRGVADRAALMQLVGDKTVLPGRDTETRKTPSHLGRDRRACGDTRSPCRSCRRKCARCQAPRRAPSRMPGSPRRP